MNNKSVTLTLNLTEAAKLSALLKSQGALPSVLTKLGRQAHKFVAMATVACANPTFSAQCRAAVENLDYKFTQKIAAIKAIRDVAFMGLADSKWAVENWDRFIAFVDANGRVPQPGFSYQPMA